MNFEEMVITLNKALSDLNPDTFNSSWILRHAPRCYSFIQRKVRTSAGQIDWDAVTSTLQRKYQRRWVPERKRKRRTAYENREEVDRLLAQYPEKLYVFIEALDQNDRRIREAVSIALVRLAQSGNLSAQQLVMELVRYTVDKWMEKYCSLSRWRGYDAEIQKQLEGCIRRYRYSGSFMRYVFSTLYYAGFGLRPLLIYNLDEPIAYDSDKCRIENVYQDGNDDIRLYGRVDSCRRKYY